MAYDEAIRSISLEADASISASTGYPSQVALAISNKALTTNVVTLTTATVHGLRTGQSVVVSLTAGDTDKATLDGTYVVASVPSETTFTYAKTASNISSAAATGTVTATIPNPTGFQYRFVKFTGVNTAGLANTTANEVVVGVLQNKPQVVGAAATVAFSGCPLVLAGGAVTAGAAVKVDSAGRGVAATLPGDAALVVGVARTSTTAANQLFSVLLKVS